MEIYIHIPFCVKKCLYCDFLSFACCDEQNMRRYVESLCREIDNWGDTLPDNQKHVETVFIGGGTPSVLPAEYIDKILCKLSKAFKIESDAEITTEANPGTVDEDKMRIYKSCGINRISFGLQSTNDEELKTLGRIHSLNDFEKSYECARKVGLHNINVDIMSALPGQTLGSYVKTLRRVCDFKPEHISAYSLIVEENTPFYNMDLNLPDEDCEREMYHETARILAQSGYERYEISNYSKPGSECRHNIGYWTGEDYLGLGLGASSYLGGIRFRNIDSLDEYLNRFSVRDNQGEIIDARLIEKMGYKDVEPNTLEDKMKEFMFLGLRMTCGVSANEFYSRFKAEIQDAFGAEIDKNIKEGLLIRQGTSGDRIALTQRGLDLANVVMADFV